MLVEVYMGKGDGEKDHQRSLGIVQCAPQLKTLSFFPSVPFCSLINGMVTRSTVGEGSGVAGVCLCTILVS